MASKEHQPDPELMLGGEDPIIVKEIREAIFLFESLVKSEKELSDSAILLSHMRDYTLARVFLMLVEGGHSTSEIVEFVERASQSLRTQRQRVVSGGNQIRVYRRDKDPDGQEH